MRLEERGRGLADAMHRMKSIDFWRLVPDMTPAEIQLLAAICGCGEGGQKISDLYGICGMQPAVVSRLMNGLEERGLIVRSARKGNRRVIDVSATEKGHALNERNMAILQGYWQEVLADIPAEDMETMLRVQWKIMDGMESVLARRLGDALQ